jgi:hypothetical protein
MAKNISKTAAAVADKIARDVAADLLGATVVVKTAKGKVPAGKVTAVRIVDKSEPLLGSPAKMAAAKRELDAAKAQNRAGKGKRGKAAAKGKGKGNGAGRPSAYTDGQRIVVVGKGKAARKGSNVAKIWAMVAKSKTIADYKKARAAAGLDGIGGMLAGFVKAGHVQVK